MKVRVLDLFSGIGGFSLGLERAGFETVGFCEIDNYASGVLKRWWSAVPNEKRGIIALNALLKRARTSSRQGFPVRTYPSLAEAPALPEPVQDSSGHYFEPFAWFDQKARCWRTWQRCLVEGWEIFSGTWPRSGMTRNGIAFQRQPLVRLTKETDSGSFLPTPEASNTKAVALRSAGRSPRNFLAPLPTPRACSGLRSSGANRTELLRAVKQWPTPVARDYKGQGMSVARRAAGKKPDNLCSAMHVEEGSGALNPTWGEWLMGFPQEWTALDASETPLSRRSRK